MTRDLTKMKEIIANLLDTEGRSPEEVRAFQDKAAKLMHKLGLTRDEILAKDPDMHMSSTQITRFDWVVAQLLFHPIERLTGTQTWYEILPTASGKRSDRKIVYFAGYRSDVDQAEWLFSHILQQASAGARGITASKERNSYLVGFAAAVGKKVLDLANSLDNLREPVRFKDGEVNDLVLASKEAVVKAYLEEMAPGLEAADNKGTVIKNRAAASAGASDGSKVSLGRGVSAGVKAIASQS